jgi:hypothetical protein
MKGAPINNARVIFFMEPDSTAFRLQNRASSAWPPA